MANPYKNTGRAGSNSPANIINPKKAAYKLAKSFFNTAKQYYKAFTKPKAINQQTPRPSNFKPFHRDGVVYDRDMINKAFKNRFGPDAQPAIRPPKIPGTNMGRADAQVKMREAYRNLRK